MVIISAEKIYKGFGNKDILNDVSLFLESKDKIGILGINGTGKSTFLKILSGIVIPDRGKVNKLKNIKISYLEQNPVFKKDISILDTILLEMPESQRFEFINIAKEMLSKMGFTDYEISTNNFSGGELKRVALAKVLTDPGDVFILDEPTNHLDEPMTEWLLNYLKDTEKTLVLVTHDRYFLDEVVNKIVEIDKSKIYSYSGNYSEFIRLKDVRKEMLESTKIKNNSIYKREEKWIKQGPKARSTKSKSRIENFNNLEKINFAKEAKLEIESMSKRLGNKVIEIDNISKAYGDKVLFKNFSCELSKYSRVGIIGSNGTGKSTLLKILSMQERPDIGSVSLGSTVKIGFLTQELIDLPLNKRLIDYISELGVDIAINSGTITPAKMLEKFLFTKDIQMSLISKLSGGEKRRLHLLRILMESPNILFLDEPTNDLDIYTLNILEEYLINFKGVIITISHDKYFLKKVATLIWEFKDNGEIKKHMKGYDSYSADLKKEKIIAKEKKKKEKNNKKKIDNNSKCSKITYREKYELENLEEKISILEEKIDIINSEFLESQNNYEVLIQLTKNKVEIEEDLEKLLDRFFCLSEKS